MSEENKAIKYYKQGYNYKSRSPLWIPFDNLDDAQKHKLLESPSFCMMPWVHQHAYPDGRVYPCCLSEYDHPVGNLKENTMREVWNQDGYKEIRRNMLSDQPVKQCTRCYEQEANGFFSMRYEANRSYGHHVSDVSLTEPDGTFPKFELKYWDVRFSNLCNFRCRSCGPIFSSNWYNDHVKLYNRVPDVNGKGLARIEYASGNEEDMIQQMEEHIPYLEQVYFAGGEPLIMKEHYHLLEKLIEAGRTDVCIQYNTNFSELAFKDKHVFEYWKHFRTVGVGASLDASGARAELMRKGTDWRQTVRNRERMLEEVPHVDFYIASTISSMNVLHVLDFHKEWVDLGFIKPKDFNVNICQSPDWYRIDIFPQEFKERVIKPAYERHLEWLEPLDTLKRATNGFRSAINLLMADDKSKYLPKFREETSLLDGLRKENFWETFPELAGLKTDGNT
jgi:radical SAM protein with 4Fe4S-binding SPASM domain